MKKQNHYEKNLRWIKTLNPNAADQLKNAEEPEWYNELYVDNQINFAIRKGAKLETVYKSGTLKKYKEICKKIPLDKENVTIIVGSGLGLLLNSLIEQKEKGHILLVYEPVPFLLKRTLELYDFSEQIKNGEMLFAVPGEDDFKAILSILESQKVVEKWEILYELYVMKLPEEYARAMEYSSEMISSLQCNTGTIMAAGAIIAQNDISNLPYVLKHRGVNDLKDLYKDKPAVLVSTGPSLQKNIHYLIHNQDKVIIIAVAQAMRVLLAYGIKPDFITTVDYGEVNIEHFKSLMHQDIPLVALNRSYAEIIKRYRGPKFITVSDVSGNPETISGLLKAKGHLDQGGSVAHLNLGFAAHLGCSPIAFTGQDLAFEGGKSHIPLVDAGGKVKTDPNTGQIVWEIDDPRSILQKEKSHGMGMTKMVTSYYEDGFVSTNIGLASFITSFEYLTKKYKDYNIYNCTEGGAKIDGSIPLTLKDYVGKFGQEDIDKSAIAKFKNEDPNSEVLITSAIKILKKERKDLRTLKKEANEAKEYAEKMLKEKDKTVLSELFKQNAIHTQKAEEIARKNQLVGLSIYKESREIQGKALYAEKGEKHLLKNKDDRKIRVERNLLILNAAIRAAEELLPLYNKTYNILKEYEKTGDENLLQSDEPDIISIDDAEDYFKVGNWGHPIIDAQYILEHSENEQEIQKAEAVKLKAEQMKSDAIADSYREEAEEKRWERIEYWKNINLSKEVGRETKEFVKVLEYLEKAEKIYEDGIDALWGLATTYYYIGNYKEAVKRYEKLIKQYPENNRFQFEYGQVLLMIDREKGMKTLQAVFDKTHEFDSFLLRVGMLYMQSGVYQQAMEAFQEYIKAYPHNAEAWLNKAKCHKALFQEFEHKFCMQRFNELVKGKK
jgi:TolA-binding protein